MFTIDENRFSDVPLTTCSYPLAFNVVDASGTAQHPYTFSGGAYRNQLSAAINPLGRVHVLATVLRFWCDDRLHALLAVCLVQSRLLVKPPLPMPRCLDLRIDRHT